MTASMLASKVWDDLSMINEDFSIISPFDNTMINNWEAQFLTAIGFNVSVTASQYAKVYFELVEASDAEVGTFPLQPLDVEEAKRLAAMSSTAEHRFKELHVLPRNSMRRCVSSGGEKLAHKHGRAVLD